MSFFRDFLNSINLKDTKPIGPPGSKRGGFMGLGKLLNPEEKEFYKMYIEKYKQDNMGKGYLADLEDKQDEQFVETVKLVIEEKYYTPSIEDIRVGYQCEVWKEWWNKDYEGKEWRPLIVSTQDIQYGGLDRVTTIGELFPVNINSRIRTPYLSKEQIEAEGWKEKDLPYVKRFFFEKEGSNYGIIFYKQETPIPTIEIFVKDPTKIEWYHTPELIRNVFPCPSINEFRFITRLLGI